ncbi:16S rRNA (guanine(527)-N(7))-methyltransferase RsmG [Sulfuricystis multivorans]|uniref:16S rRNA (guanine(527)-N(7))-methyltransferase RsmG n=1 Tax=Sulfuricystis multivorans TaxID=2211108 RepID=UPI000F8178CF|nr:16S rRNA (guanine(527)-N(7))-methyltransferase RsmG [Sulfuricystis multivorans]
MTLAEGIAALGLALPTGAEEKLSAYLALVAKWNKVHNLTAIRAPEAMVTQHLLDSLAVLPILRKSALAGRQYTLADVGSGAGLPGLVLAIAQPDWRVTSIEAAGKKAAFQRQAKIELGLTNVSIYCGRVEDCQERFEGVIARAFASLGDFVRLAGHLSDRLWAMKGAYPADEIAAVPSGWRVVASHALRVPGLDAQRCLLQLEREH